MGKQIYVLKGIIYYFSLYCNIFNDPVCIYGKQLITH